MPGAPGQSQPPVPGRAQPPAPAAPVAPPAVHTQSPPPVAASAARPPVPQQQIAKKPDLVSLTLRMTDDLSGETRDPNEPLKFAVEPLGRQMLSLKVRNQSGIVDNYDLGLRGIPDDWYTIAPATVYLVPFGSAGTYEQEVTVQIHPPKTPEAESRFWDIELTALSRAHEIEAAAVPASMFIHPYEDYDAKVRPERRTARRRARYDVELENKSNAETVIWLSAADPDLAFKYTFDKPYIKLKPSEKRKTSMHLKAKKRIWLGRKTERRFELGTHVSEAEKKPDEVELMENNQAKKKRKKLKEMGRERMTKSGVTGPRLQKGNINIGQGGIHSQGPQMYKGSVSSKNINFDNLKLPGFKRNQQQFPAGPLTPRQGAFVQKPIFSWWLPIVIAMLIIAAIIIYLLWPRNIKVPNVVGKKTADAQKIIKNKNLVVEKTETRTVRDPKQIGVVIDQAPNAGKKVKKNTGVDLFVGVGDGLVTIPDLKKKNVDDASKALDSVKLSLGQVGPDSATKDPKHFFVKTQFPLPGARKPVGTPVRINVVKPPPPKTKKNESGSDKKKAEAAAVDAAVKDTKGTGDPVITVPPFDGKNDDSYSQDLTNDTLTPNIVPVFDPAPVGNVIKTDPAPGTKAKNGQQVTVFISQGIPQFAADNIENVVRFNGANGNPLAAPAKGTEKESHPSWSPDGKFIVFQSGNQILMQDMLHLDHQARILTSDKDVYDNPTFAPSPDKMVIALTRERTGVVDGADKDFQDGDLCFAEIPDKGKIEPSCIEDPSVNANRDIAWAPDGKSIYTIGSDNTQGEVLFGVVQYTSAKEFSTRAGDWKGGDIVTPVDESKQGIGVMWIAISPDGQSTALIGNTSGGRFQLFITGPADAKNGDHDVFGIAKATPVTNACEASWRPDGLEVAVVLADATTCGFLSNDTTELGQLATIKIAITDKGAIGVPSTARILKSNVRHAVYKPEILGQPKTKASPTAPDGSDAAGGATGPTGAAGADPNAATTGPTG